MSDFLVSSLTVAGIYGLMALALNLQAGYAGLLNFGHIAFAGLGAYATGIVVQAGGNVRIYSEPGLGTTVTVLLPVTGEPSGQAGAFPDEAAQGGGERVLVVEDEPAMREVTRRILAGNGYQVTAAANRLSSVGSTATVRRANAKRSTRPDA